MEGVARAIQRAITAARPKACCVVETTPKVKSAVARFPPASLCDALPVGRPGPGSGYYPRVTRTQRSVQSMPE